MPANAFPDKACPGNRFAGTHEYIYGMLLRLLTGLVANCAGCLACRLAGSLALAAAAFFYCVLQLCGI